MFRQRNQRRKLAGSEEVTPLIESVRSACAPRKPFWNLALGLPCRLALPSDRFMVLGSGQVRAAALSLGHDSHEPHAQASGLPFFFDVLVRNRIAG